MAPHAEGRVELVVKRGKEILRRCELTCSHGELQPAPASDSAVRERGVDVTLTLTPADADGVSTGSLDPSVAFMRGQMKVEGDFELLLTALPLTRGPGFDAVRRCLAAE